MVLLPDGRDIREALEYPETREGTNLSSLAARYTHTLHLIALTRITLRILFCKAGRKTRVFGHWVSRVRAS